MRIPLTARFGSSQQKSIESNKISLPFDQFLDRSSYRRESTKISFVFSGKEISRRSRIFPARRSLDEWCLFQEFERELFFRKGHYEKFACEDLSNRRITEFCEIVRELIVEGVEERWCFLSWILWYVKMNCLNMSRGYVRVGEWHMRNFFFNISSVLICAWINIFLDIYRYLFTARPFWLLTSFLMNWSNLSLYYSILQSYVMKFNLKIILYMFGNIEVRFYQNQIWSHQYKFYFWFIEKMNLLSCILMINIRSNLMCMIKKSPWTM